MKSIILRAGLLTCFILIGLSHGQAFADMTWPAKCSAYGDVQPNQNPSSQQINCLLTNAALAANIPPEVVKAVAEKESGWRQFDGNGQPFVSQDGGIGIMQITNQSAYDQEKLKDDIDYNIEAGVETLSSMYNRTDLPKIKGAGQQVIENWYFPVMAYNGTKPVNSPLYQSSGAKNTNAYQEQVFALLEQESFLGDNPLAQFPFSTSDFDYQPGSDQNIIFKKMEYTLMDPMHATNYLFQAGDKVVVTLDGVNFRSEPTSSSTSLKVLGKNTTLIINGNFVYDQSSSSVNQFVWYPVKTEDQKLTGYISSAYISKKLDSPIINTVDDNDTSVTGKASANALVQIMKGTVKIGSATSDANGNFKAGIPVQKAGSQLTVIYTDSLNRLSPSTAITVIDKTAPAVPLVNTVTNISSSVSGKTETNATVSVVISGKTYSAKADQYGNYKVAITVQNTGTSLVVTAKDSAGNISAARTVSVVRAAPNMPSINTVNNKAATVTGKTEANATVSVVISGKTYSAKADKYGNYKVAIPIQNTGTILSVTAKDSGGHISAARTATVVRAAPNMPTINTVNNKSTTVTGKAEANATVSVVISGKTYSAKADKYGNYKVGIPIQNTGTILSVTAKDSTGHISVARGAAIIRVAPNMPSVNTVRSYSTTVTGKTEKYATVAIKIGSRTYTAKANVNGDYKVTIPKQRTGTKLYVTAKDAKGQVSATRTVTVS